MTTMPKQKPGRSKQDYGTPRNFIEAVEARLGDTLNHDLAASKDNTICEDYYDEERNSLTVNWAEETRPCWCWLNPPFGKIAPWVAKCVDEASQGCHIAVLVPTSHANWWLRYVEGKCYINYLHGRLTFVGEDKPYPKDCALLLYTPWGMKGSEVWDWRSQSVKASTALTVSPSSASSVTDTDHSNRTDSSVLYVQDLPSELLVDGVVGQEQ